LIPARVAAIITEQLDVPTISIGSGAECSGHCQIFHDAIGMFEAFVPRHAKQYCSVGKVIAEAMDGFVDDTQSGAYPGPEHSFKVDRETLRALQAHVEARGN